MADFVAVLKKTLDGLGDTTPEMRTRVYDKARSTIAAKLAAIDPPPPASVAERQRRALEDAIRQVEGGYARPAAQPSSADPLAELENIFSSIDRNRNQPNHARPGAAPAVAPRTAAAPRTEAPPPRPQPSAPVPQPAARTTTHTGYEPKPVSTETAWKKTSPAPVSADTEKRGAGAARPLPAPEFDDLDDEPVSFEDHRLHEEPTERRRGYGGLIAALVALAVIAGGGYGIWLNKDAFEDMLGLNKTETAKQEPAEPAKPAETAKAEPEETVPPATEPSASQPAAGETQKFTQRLQPDGRETDPGPAGGENHIGEGTSVVALTTPAPGTPPVESPAPGAATPSDSPADGTQSGAAAPPASGESGAPAASSTPPAAGQSVAVAQKAIFYEERTNTADGSAEPGSIVWSLVQESPGGDAPPEPAIRAEATIPGKDIQLRMTIRRNTDQTLPASHIIEMIFLTPDGFDGGGIDNVLRMAMKGTEQEAGSPLIGIPAKISDGFFLIALNDTKADEDANLTLLRNQDWIDIPVVYKSGRRALLTMEKGIPGEKVFDEALKAWQAKDSG